MMIRVLALATALLTTGLPAGAHADPVDDLMRHVTAQAHIPGAAVAIVRDGKVVKLKAYGTASLEYGVPVTARTPFQIASSGKIYTAVLLMRMVDQGMLTLDDPATRYVPDAPPAWRDIMVRDLAAHLSGLAPVDIGPDSVSTLDAVHQAFAAKVLAPPGQRAAYDSFDYTLLQYILEKAGGAPYPSLLRKYVLEPAAMTCTDFDMAETRGLQRVAANVPGRAEYYRWVDGANERRWFMYARYAYAAGGVYSCVGDMARLLSLLDRGTFLSAASMKLLTVPVAMRSGKIAGFSVGLATGSYRGHRWIGHSGGPAFSDVLYFPDDHLAVAVFTNQQRLSPRIASLVADRYLAAGQEEAAPAMADPFPNLTVTARRLLEGAAAGKVDATLFAKSRRATYVDDLDDIGPVWMGLLGPMTRFVLLSDQPSAEGRIRKYRATYGEHPEVFTIEFDRDGAITEIASGE